MDISHLDIAKLIQSALAPVFLISGVASTLVVLTNRLARAVDRARKLESEEPVAEPHHIEQELKVLARRAFYINTAISMCGMAALLITLVVVALFASAFFDMPMAGTIAALFVGAMLFLMAAFLAFLVEVRVATNSLRIGLRAHVKSAAARSSRQAEKPATI